METKQNDHLRAALVRYLETDLLFGVRAAPLKTPTMGKTARQKSGGLKRHTPPETAPQPHRQTVSPEELARRTEALRVLNEQHVTSCQKCQLSQTRTKTVFGQGDPAARLVFVGEAPGRDEDLQGIAFIGRAGQLLTKMIEAMGLSRDEVFICNILKCRPPNNRDPAQDEVSACWPYLDQQLKIIHPEVIVTLGKPATQTLLRSTASIGSLRGRWHDYHMFGEEQGGQPIPLMPTYHPAYLLRSPGEKAKAWSDLKQVMARLGLAISK